ncbi:hypothetical protein NEHOM01_0988 [Nematocida homosporus]|uniref:uncharacterized protein n=1 Tax=Nematocida homosporus TaxID=1912981 RepID=UPI0022205DC0|nr:uncharacterized protein NEHOM01_0988 [Nematocida homosporus]KAI5185696.1 hypothetical protein NEHOM01_0988 [Nematocida homosporus]
MRIKECIARVKELEARMDSLITDLKQKYNFEIGDRLVDSQNYPRNDIDIYPITKILAELKSIRYEWLPLRKALEEEILNNQSDTE